MSTRIIFVYGNAWDRGKDLLSRLLIEHLLSADASVLLVEPFWDKARLSAAYEGLLHVLPIPLSEQPLRLEGFGKVPGLIEASRCDYVLFNLSGTGIDELGAQALDSLFDIDKRLKLVMTMAYVAGPSQRSYDHLEETWAEGMGTAVDDNVVVMNSYYGALHKFCWMDSPLRRDVWKPMREGEGWFWRQRPSALAEVHNRNGRVWPGKPGCMAGLPPKVEAAWAQWLEGQRDLAKRILHGIPGEDRGTPRQVLSEIENRDPAP